MITSEWVPITIGMNGVSRKTWEPEATSGAILITYEGPGITTRSEVKRSERGERYIANSHCRKIKSRNEGMWGRRPEREIRGEGREEERVNHLRVVVRNTSRVTKCSATWLYDKLTGHTTTSRTLKFSISRLPSDFFTTILRRTMLHASPRSHRLPNPNLLRAHATFFDLYSKGQYGASWSTRKCIPRFSITAELRQEVKYKALDIYWA